MMDMRALKFGQQVVLSDALPGDGTTGVVTEVAKWHVMVVVAARIDGVDGAYCVEFDYDNNVYVFFDWTDSKAGWEIGWAIPCPIPDLKIVSSCD